MKVQRREFLATFAAASQALSQSTATSINGGRQLFFDDYVIGESTLRRTWHKPEIHPASPVLRPETPLEMNDGARPVACPFTDGLFYDPEDRLFKLWYHAGWFDGIAYATSEDGIHWTRPNLDVVPGTNRVVPKRPGYSRDGATIWLDHNAASREERFKLFCYSRRAKPLEPVGEVYISADGIHWKGPHITGPLTDNSNFYHDPFRKQWVWSIRSHRKAGRMRRRRVHSEFIGGLNWTERDIIDPLLIADELDQPDPKLGFPTELYHVEANAYEDFMLGVFLIHRGPPNKLCDALKVPKITEMTLGFSRDGATWARPDRSAFIGASRQPLAWNRAYIHPAGGVCLVVGDKLYFYFGAFSGVSPKLGADMYAGGSTGLAVLRRDGFVSLDADGSGGSLTTRPITFSGRHLFVNADAEGGEVAVEVLDGDGKPLNRYTAPECVAARSNNTCQPVRWKTSADVGSLVGKPVRLRFHVRSAKLYSFWVSPERTGASMGFVAAGGPGFTGPRDTVGAGRNLV